MRKTSCLLCQGQHLTTWFKSACLYYICLCVTCGVPMAALRDHGRDPSPLEEQRILQMLGTIAEKHFGGQAWVFDHTRRTLTDHWHVHTRLA